MFKIIFKWSCFLLLLQTSVAQNPLQIPPLLSGTTFTLTIQSGTQQFYSGFNTPTYGINGVWMAPTLLLNKGDSVTLNVRNNLNNFTTLHWHGFHVAAKNDGGPHQIIVQNGGTWNPSFKVRNDAGTFWYHPHGVNKTDLHVSKGIAGMIIIKDALESALTLPRNYGVDDIPVIVQSKAFDVFKQIAIATESDTAIFVNGTLHALASLPAQVVRLRFLNGSSMRTYNFGFTGNLPFYLIATDGGLIDAPITLTRLRLSPGERAEVLVDLSGMQSQTIYLKSFASEFPNGIYGAAIVGGGAADIPGYTLNPLNGVDFDIMQINIIAPTVSPVTIIPAALTTNTVWPLSSVNVNRRIELKPSLPDSSHMAEGPFWMNGEKFEMDSINEIIRLNNVEMWNIVNKTLIAHPFHIHDIQFYIVDVNGNPPPAYENGKKDVVLVMPGDSVRFITKFEDFADDMMPYMYHCHLLHHEDDDMMGQFIVIDTTKTSVHEQREEQELIMFPTPCFSKINIHYSSNHSFEIDYSIINLLGQTVTGRKALVTNGESEIYISDLKEGIYILKIKDHERLRTFKIIKQ